MRLPRSDEATPAPAPARAGYWRGLYRSKLPFREFHATGAMNAVDLARTEAWIHAPSGACVCCLRSAPLKLGARCVDCVANESASFEQGSADAPVSPVKCATSHVHSVFTCVLCEVRLGPITRRALLAMARVDGAPHARH